MLSYYVLRWSPEDTHSSRSSPEERWYDCVEREEPEAYEAERRRYSESEDDYVEVLTPKNKMSSYNCQEASQKVQ